MRRPESRQRGLAMLRETQGHLVVVVSGKTPETMLSATTPLGGGVQKIHLATGTGLRDWHMRDPMVIESHPQVQPAMLARRGIELAPWGVSRPEMIISIWAEVNRRGPLRCPRRTDTPHSGRVRARQVKERIGHPPLSSARAGAMTGTHR